MEISTEEDLRTGTESTAESPPPSKVISEEDDDDPHSKESEMKTTEEEYNTPAETIPKTPSVEDNKSSFDNEVGSDVEMETNHSNHNNVSVEGKNGPDDTVNDCEGAKPSDDAPITETLEKEPNSSSDSTQATSRYTYDFEPPFTLVTTCSKEFSNHRQVNNFLKGCKWAPDGSCLMTSSEDQCIRLFNLPVEMYNISSELLENQLPLQDILPVLKIQEGGLIYDFSWLPQMNSADPATCCFLSTSKDNPIHMWDAFDGHLRCSYLPINNVDEVTSARCLSFDPAGQKIYAGFYKYIRIFDVSVPGRKSVVIQTYSRKSEFKRQSGIISCITPHPVLTGVFAAGSYLRTVGLYDLSSAQLLCLLAGQRQGLTHLQFSPDGVQLYAGGRMDPEIICWDIRNPGKVLFVLKRTVTTNQRMYFDMSVCGRYLASGNSDNYLNVWDVTDTPKRSAEGPVIPYINRFLLHDDCINGVSFHRQLPLIATASGQRHFPAPNSGTDSGSDSDESLLNWDDVHIDNSLKIWWTGGGRKNV